MKKLLSLFFVFCLISPYISLSSSADAFNYELPNFSLYSVTENIFLDAKVEYILNDRDGFNVTENSAYDIEGLANAHYSFFIPFICAPFNLPKFNVTENKKIVTGKFRYGEKWSVLGVENIDMKTILQNSNSAENRAEQHGALYIFNLNGDHFRLELPKDKGFLYETTGREKISVSDTFVIEISQPKNETFCVFVVDNDFSVNPITAASFTKEDITGKQFCENHAQLFTEYYESLGNIPYDFFYSQLNKIAKHNLHIKTDELFWQEVSEKYLVFYEFKAVGQSKIEYSLPISVQCNSLYNPPIYKLEQVCSQNYAIDYSVICNESFPYITESSGEMQTDGYTYTLSDNKERFYCVFSTSKNPVNRFETDTTNKIPIELKTVYAVSIVLLVLVVIIILSFL